MGMTRLAVRNEIKSTGVCGTYWPGYLDVYEHPTLANGTSVKARICFYWNEEKPCVQSVETTVTNCGGFFVYDLLDVPAGPSGYCGA